MLTVLLGGNAAVVSGRAQPAQPKLSERFLFVFDTSSEMKRRLPAVKGALATLLATGANGQMRANDSIGVWTFDQDLHAGQFPLELWQPDKAVMIASNINTFISDQHYSKKTSFETLVPVLNQIVQHSERLTVVIFCDGYGEVHGTPYDSGINQVFKQRRDEREKERLPIAIAMRSQLGQYVDCMVSFPPQPVSLPVFPPLPEPPPPPKAALPPPRTMAPPLIIIGPPPTNRAPPPGPPAAAPVPVSTNRPVVVTSAPPPVAGEVEKPASMPLMSTNVAGPVQLKMDAKVLAETNAAAPPEAEAGTGRIGAALLGLAFLAVAVGLTVFLVRYVRSTKKD